MKFSIFGTEFCFLYIAWAYFRNALRLAVPEDKIPALPDQREK